MREPNPFERVGWPVGELAVRMFDAGTRHLVEVAEDARRFEDEADADARLADLCSVCSRIARHVANPTNSAGPPTARSLASRLSPASALTCAASSTAPAGVSGSRSATRSTSAGA